MVKEFDKRGLPTAHVVNMVPVARDVGSNRIIHGVSIPHPLGGPKATPEESFEIRELLVQKAIGALSEELTEQKIYD